MPLSSGKVLPHTLFPRFKWRLKKLFMKNSQNPGWYSGSRRGSAGSVELSGSSQGFNSAAPAALGVPATLQDVSLSLFKGEAALEGLPSATLKA